MMIQEAKKLLGVKYEYGAKWDDITKPPDSLDCSGLTNGIARVGGIVIAHGAQNQFYNTDATLTPFFGDLAFFGHDGNPEEVYHVGLLYDRLHIVEARAKQEGSSFPTGIVILRPKAKWENYRNFLGYRTIPELKI